jgi:hypothetical protein
LVKLSPSVQDQLRKLYKETMVQFLGSKILTFRSMHLHGRALNDLVPLAVDDVEEYDVFIESQPLGRDTMHWRIADAATGQLDEGHVRVSGLRAVQPWGSDRVLVGSAR